MNKLSGDVIINYYNFPITIAYQEKQN